MPCAMTIKAHKARMIPAPMRDTVTENAPYCLKGARRYCGNRIRQKVVMVAPVPITAMSTCAKFTVMNYKI